MDKIKDKKMILKAVILILLLVFYIYVANITLLPKNLIFIQGEKINFRMAWGLKIQEQEISNPNIYSYSDEGIVEASQSEASDLKEIGKIEFSLQLGDIKLKEISATIVPKLKVIPLGNAIGLKLYTSGVLVVGMSEIEGEKPYENTGIEEGDRITEINHSQITSAEDLVETVNRSKGNSVTVKYVQNETEKETTMTPARTKENEYKLGLWVRDAAAGVGTASFYVPSTGEVAALRPWNI